MEYKARIKATVQKRTKGGKSTNFAELQEQSGNSMHRPTHSKWKKRRKKKKKKKKAGNHIRAKRKKKNRTYSDKEVTSTKW